MRFANLPTLRLLDLRLPVQPGALVFFQLSFFVPSSCSSCQAFTWFCRLSAFIRVHLRFKTTAFAQFYCCTSGSRADMAAPAMPIAASTAITPEAPMTGARAPMLPAISSTTPMTLLLTAT